MFYMQYVHFTKDLNDIEAHLGWVTKVYTVCATYIPYFQNEFLFNAAATLAAPALPPIKFTLPGPKDNPAC